MRVRVRAVSTLVLYAAAVVWLTWPLPAHLATHLPNTSGPSSTDVPYITWVMAYQAHALVTDPSGYLDGNIYYPARHTVLYGDPGLGALPIFAPIFLATGNPTLAINLVLLVGIALTAWSLHLVVERWTGSWLAGVVGASTFLTNPWEIPWFFGWAPTYTVLFYLPVIAYLAARPLTRVRDAVALAVLVALQSASNMVYLAASTFVPLGLLVVLRVLRRKTFPEGARLAGVLLLGGVLLAPIYVGYGLVRHENLVLERQSTWARLQVPEGGAGDAVVAPLRPDRFLPAALLWRRDPTWLAPPLLALIVAGTLAMPWARAGCPGLASAWRHGLLWSAAGLALSTPGVAWRGMSMQLPHYWLLESVAPFVNVVVREHKRLGFPCLVGFALLAGAGLVACARVVPRRWRGVARVLLATTAVGGAVLSHGAAATWMALLSADDGSSTITRLLAEGDGPVLELPVSATGVDPHFHAPPMYRSIFHWRPILNGYSSYWPAEFPARMELARRLPDEEALMTLVRETGLAAVVVNLGRYGLPDRHAWLMRAQQGDVGRLHFVTGDTKELLFAISPAP
ncbi:MAG: hypothetical protein ACREQL_13570 [Candidatus Binatia bacterium]